MYWVMILFPYVILLGVVVFLLRQLNQERVERQDLINHMLRTYTVQQMNHVSHETPETFIPFPDGHDLNEDEIRAIMDEAAHRSSVEENEGS